MNMIENSIMSNRYLYVGANPLKKIDPFGYTEGDFSATYLADCCLWGNWYEQWQCGCSAGSGYGNSGTGGGGYYSEKNCCWNAHPGDENHPNDVYGCGYGCHCPSLDHLGFVVVAINSCHCEVIDSCACCYVSFKDLYSYKERPTCYIQWGDCTDNFNYGGFIQSTFLTSNTSYSFTNSTSYSVTIVTSCSSEIDTSYSFANDPLIH